MITTQETLARPVSLSNAATAIFATLGLIDVALTAVIGSSDAPPLIVSLGVAALGLITLLALAPARRGSRGALTAIVVTRVISAVLAVPAFFLNAPAWVGYRVQVPIPAAHHRSPAMTQLGDGAGGPGCNKPGASPPGHPTPAVT